MKLHVNLQERSYDIIMEKGIINHLNDYINLKRKVMIITDDNIPKSYYETILKQCKEGFVEVIPHGETSKSLTMFEHLCTSLLQHNFTRKDCIIALGGGVIGDLSGYVAASYMRGIDFIQVPTTTLSQIDSSIGGKVAINLGEVKNIVGAFYQPKAVFVDVETLKSLPKRHFYNGLVEALKAGMIYDASLFDIFESEDIENNLETIIYKSLTVKKSVVEQDEKEEHLRKILNFGHTIGHAIESYFHLDTYYHGECVAFGMLYFTNDEIKARLQPIYDKLHLPSLPDFDHHQVFNLLTKDKKANHNGINVVLVEEIGKAQIKQYSFTELKELLS